MCGGTAFCASSTQWRVGGMGGLLGLDYAGARAACKGLGIKWREALPGLRVMEAAVVHQSNMVAT